MSPNELLRHRRQMQRRIRDVLVERRLDERRRAAARDRDAETAGSRSALERAGR